MMEFLLDPNVAYLILLVGVLLAFLAIVTPGTGMLEVGALFCITLAGYAVYNLSFNWWALLMLGLSIVPFVYALQKPKREVYLVFAILLLVVGSVFIFPSQGQWFAVNPVVAILASGLISVFLWIAVRKSIEAAHAKPMQDLNSLIGQIGRTKTPVNGEGSVYVGGELWSARSEQPISAGSAVRVISRDGFFVTVEKINHSSS
jgi:membrane-bound serine protease (ClpP class)